MSNDTRTENVTNIEGSELSPEGGLSGRGPDQPPLDIGESVDPAPDARPASMAPDGAAPEAGRSDSDRRKRALAAVAAASREGDFELQILEGFAGRG